MKKINPILESQLSKTFLQMVSDLDGIEEVQTFFVDFFTKKEMRKLSTRLAVAYWLKKGRDNKNIKDNLVVTHKVINNISKKLNRPGYKLGLKKVEAEEWANVWAQRIKKLGIGR